jgi:hypothetical protein
LKNNALLPEDQQVVQKVMEENNYSAEHGDNVYELSSSVTDGKPGDFGTDLGNNTNNVMRSSALKMFIF